MTTLLGCTLLCAHTRSPGWHARMCRGNRSLRAGCSLLLAAMTCWLSVQCLRITDKCDRSKVICLPGGKRPSGPAIRIANQTP